MLVVVSKEVNVEKVSVFGVLGVAHIIDNACMTLSIFEKKRTEQRKDFQTDKIITEKG